MKIQNAINKLQKNGFIVTHNGSQFSAKKGNCKRVVEFSRNGHSDEAVCIGFRHEDDHTDIQSDYFAKTYCNSLTQAMRYAAA
jgi:hypothetical protein